MSVTVLEGGTVVGTVDRGDGITETTIEPTKVLNAGETAGVTYESRFDCRDSPEPVAA